MTHSELVTAAADWLYSGAKVADEFSRGGVRRVKCPVVVTDMTTGNRETPDAIGWWWGESILVECKAGKSDYYSDKHKTFRKHPETGMGNYRYYMAPKGLISKKSLPEKWGLVEVHLNGRCKTVVVAEFQEARKEGELIMLMSTLRRLPEKLEGVTCNYYTVNTDRPSRACVYVEPEGDLL